MQTTASFPQLLTTEQEKALCTFVVSLLLACCGCYVYYLTFDFTLTKTYDFAVSKALQAGVDAPKRVSLYYQLLLIFCGVYVASYKITEKLLVILQQTLQGSRLRFALQSCTILCAGLTALLSLQFIFPNPKRSYIEITCLLVLLFLLLYLLHFSRFAALAAPLAHWCSTFMAKIHAVSKNLSAAAYVNLWMAFAIVATFLLSMSRNGKIELVPFFYVALGIFCGNLTFIVLGKLVKQFPAPFSSKYLPRAGAFLSGASRPDTTTALIFLLLLCLQFCVRAILRYPDALTLFTWRHPFILSYTLYLLSIFFQSRFKFSGRLFLALAPLLLLPFSYTLATEVQYFLTKWIILNTYHIFLFLIFLLFLSSYLIWSFNKEYKKEALLKFLYIPVLLCTFYICSAWQPTITLREDLLHTGNPVVLPQQILEYNQWPFIDFMPARGFQWSVGPLLYNLFNGLGENGIESVVARHIPLELLFGCLLAYFILCYFVRPLVALLITELFCFNMGFFGYAYYGITLVEVPVFLWYLKKQTPARLCLTWLLPLLIFVYHPASGKYAILATSLTFLVTFIKKPRELCKVFLFGGAVFCLSGLCYFTVLHLCDKSITETLLQILAFGKSQNVIGSYPHILHEVSPSTFYLFLLIPIISVLALLFCSNKIINAGEISPHILCLLYIALCLIFMTTTSLSRHSPYEKNFIPSFFSMVFFIFPLILGIKKIYYMAWLALLLLIHPIWFSSIPLYRPQAITFKTAQWNEARPSRVTVIADGKVYGANYTEITEFLKTHLRKDETFVDLIDAHLLYAKTHKPMPFFQHAIRVIRFLSPQKSFVRTMQEKYDRGQIPLALVDSTSWGLSNLDGSPSQTQFYVIQWLYAHYEPYKIVNGFQIWAAKNSRFAKESREDFPITQKHDWGKLAGIWANALLSEITGQGATSAGNRQLPLDSQPQSVPLKDFGFIENGTYIVFKIRAREAATVSGELSFHNVSGKFSFQVEPSDEGKYYTFPLNALYAGYLRPENILLSADKPVQLEISR